MNYKQGRREEGQRKYIVSCTTQQSTSVCPIQVSHTTNMVPVDTAAIMNWFCWLGNQYDSCPAPTNCIGSLPLVQIMNEKEEIPNKIKRNKHKNPQRNNSKESKKTRKDWLIAFRHVYYIMTFHSHLIILYDKSKLNNLFIVIFLFRV